MFCSYNKRHRRKKCVRKEELNLKKKNIKNKSNL